MGIHPGPVDRPVRWVGAAPAGCRRCSCVASLLYVGYRIGPVTYVGHVGVGHCCDGSAGLVCPPLIRPSCWPAGRTDRCCRGSPCCWARAECADLTGVWL